MKKKTKLSIVLALIAIGLISWFFSFAFIGAGVSGSGCGIECEDSVSIARRVNLIFFGLAVLVGVLPSKCNQEVKGSRGEPKL